MSDHLTDTTSRIAALLAEHRPRPAGIRDLVECSCGDEATYTPDRAYATHLAAVLAEAGIGFVAEVERERDEWKRRRDAAVETCRFRHQDGLTAEQWHANICGAMQGAQRERARAERAEAALAGLRERGRALAEKWGIAAQDDGIVGDADFAEAIRDSGAWRFARDFRTLLNEEEA